MEAGGSSRMDRAWDSGLYTQAHFPNIQALGYKRSKIRLSEMTAWFRCKPLRACSAMEAEGLEVKGGGRDA